MNIKYEFQGDTILIKEGSSLLEHLRSGIIHKDSTVYDFISGAYKPLKEVTEVKALGLDNDINAYLGYDQKVLLSEQKKNKKAQNSKTVVKITSLVILSIGILIKLGLLLIAMQSQLGMNPGLLGVYTGRVISYILLGAFVWWIIWKWVKKGGMGILLILFSLFYTLSALKL